MFDTDGNQRVDKNEFLVVSLHIKLNYINIYLIKSIIKKNISLLRQIKCSIFFAFTESDEANSWWIIQTAEI